MNEVTDTDVRAAAGLAAHDRRATRLLIQAQQTEAVTRARIAVADATTDRELRLAEQRQRLAAANRAARAREAEQAHARQQAHRAEAAHTRRERAAGHRARRAAVIGGLRARVDDVYAAGIYLLAVGGAVYGQITAATARCWPLLAGVVVAAAVEGLALVMALTAQKLRLAGEAAGAPRALTWLCAGTAAAINYLGHVKDSPDGAIVLAVLSTAGIIVWEIRSGATHRAALRARGMLPDPPASFGWRRWLRFPPTTAAAWSVDVRDRVSPRAAHLLRVAAGERRTRDIFAEQRQVRRLARMAVGTAIRHGETDAVLTSLTWLATHGTLRPVPALPAPADLSSPTRDRTHTTRLGPRRPQCRPGPDQTAPAEPSHADVDRGPDSADTGPGPGARRAGGLASPVHDAGNGPGRSAPPAAPPDQAPTRPPAGQRSRTRSPRGTVPAGTGPRTAPDVSDLLDAGRRVRDRLAAHGVPLSRSVLIKGLRADQMPVSTDRATALLAALRAGPPATKDRHVTHPID